LEDTGGKKGKKQGVGYDTQQLGKMQEKKKKNFEGGLGGVFTPGGEGQKARGRERVWVKGLSRKGGEGKGILGVLGKMQRNANRGEETGWGPKLWKKTR